MPSSCSAYPEPPTKKKTTARKNRKSPGRCRGFDCCTPSIDGVNPVVQGFLRFFLNFLVFFVIG